MYRTLQYRINSCKHWLNRPSRVEQVCRQMLAGRVVVPCRLEDVQVVPHRIVKSGERSVMKERRLDRHITNRRGPELVAIIRVVSYVLAPEVLIRARAIKAVVRIERRYLGNSDYMVLKVAEHLIRLTADLVALDAARLPEEQQSTLLLVLAQGTVLAASETIDRCVGKNQSKLELSNGPSEHIECDLASLLHRREDLAEQRSIRWDSIQPPKHLGPYSKVVSRESESRDLRPLGRRDKC